MKTKLLLILFALGLGLALVWVLGGGSTPTVAALRAEGDIEAPSAPTAELHVCPSGCTYSSIQDAVDAAGDGEVIKVATGVYTGVSARPVPAGYEGAPASGLITQVVYISKTVTVRGGYTTDFTDPPDPEANPTTLDAEGRGRGLFITGGISSTVEGLHITGGNAAGLGGFTWETETRDCGGGVHVIAATVTIRNNQVFNNISVRNNGGGGGLYLDRIAGTVSGNIIFGNTGVFGGGLLLDDSNVATLSGNTFSANTASHVGGGLMLAWSDAIVSGNIISGNTSTDNGGGLIVAFSDAVTVSGNTFSANIATTGVGGGLLMGDSDGTVSGNTISANTAGDAGGGLHLENSAATVRGNMFSANTANYGGGLQASHSDATLINNIIADNRATYQGSGVRVKDSSPRLLHNTIARNKGGDGSGVHVTDNSAVELVNTVLVGHRVGIYVSSSSSAEMEATLWGSGAWANTTDRSGPGTITHSNDRAGDPAFVSPAAGDYHIGPGSAAIDEGVDAGVDDDMDGELRTDGHPDIGADEFPHNPGLTITKQASPDTVEPGDRLTYTISIANTGDKYLHATITDTLPLSVTLEEASGGTLVLPGGTLAPPDGTVVLPDGRVAVVWTAVITAPGGTWVGTILVTVNEDSEGPLVNLVEVTTKEGVTGEARAIVNAHKVYLPLVMRGFL